MTLPSPAPAPGPYAADGPFLINQADRATWSPQRSVLVLVHHATAGNRLADVLPLIETDHRVQVFYTCPPTSPYAATGAEHIRHLDGIAVPWDEVRKHRFDLALSANLGGLQDVAAPVLALPHGSGPGRLMPRVGGHGPAAPRPASGSPAGGLITHGRVLPSVLGVAHERLRNLFASAAPAAAEVVRVVGDPCHDRITAGRALRERYRRALGASPGDLLVVLSSTHGPHSLLGAHPRLPERLAAEAAGAGVRTAAVTHPAVFAWHGRRQVRSWLSGAQRRGMVLLPPEQGWQAAVIAADAVVGDYGSVTYYAAAQGRPVLVASYSGDEVLPGSHTDLLGCAAPRLAPERPLLPQVRAALDAHAPERGGWYASQLTSAPGRAAARLRAAMYRLLGLDEPDCPPSAAPPPVPVPMPPLDGPHPAGGPR
ncbi:hypothetical protein [Nocardiopsis suaedae]|uniref:Uncharacterized protein n=1 Tax=Nocardiopsis suaedae TaxID=3018444 RepID=A0ABT4TGP6_9ACTN|nr:hypothetical protein [Nocardiopsis suaedae]MDA2803878.1 hypothetical protein [Nocardiopsis suaedae]